MQSASSGQTVIDDGRKEMRITSLDPFDVVPAGAPRPGAIVLSLECRRHPAKQLVRASRRCLGAIEAHGHKDVEYLGTAGGSAVVKSLPTLRATELARCAMRLKTHAALAAETELPWRAPVRSYVMALDRRRVLRYLQHCNSSS
jgi:hypothetical protein